MSTESARQRNRWFSPKRAFVLSMAVAGTALMVGSGASAATRPRAATGDGTAPHARSAASGPPTSLAGLCPNPVGIALDWAPEAEQAAYYGLAATTGGQVDASAKTYTAPLIDPYNGRRTGVDVRLYAGGPAVGYLHPEQVMYENSGVLIGAGETDTEVIDYTRTPTIGIVAPMRLLPTILFWSPAKYHFSGIRAIGKTNVTVQYYQGSGYMDYLMAAGILKKSQTFGGYTGSPARFVASGGSVVSQGFATFEPYYYSHQLKQWDKPIAYQLVQDVGYAPYNEAGYTKPQYLSKYAGCFKRLVPMIQESEIRYLQKPTPVSQLIVRLVNAYDIGKPYNLAIANYTHQTVLADRIESNPSTGAFGSFDMARVARLITQLKSSKTVTNLPASYGPSSLATNRFIDPNVKMTFYKGPFNDTSGVIIEK